MPFCLWTRVGSRNRVLKLIHTDTPDTTKLFCLCRVRFVGVNSIADNSRLSPTENLKSGHVHSNRPVYTGTPDTTRLSRLPVDRRHSDAGQHVVQLMPLPSENPIFFCLI